MAQTGLPKEISRQAMAYGQELPREKIFIHLARHFSLTGEICWFKLYVTEGPANRPSLISRVAHIDLLDDRNRSVWEGHIELAEGIGSGSFRIPASLSSGHYQLRAYTRWMLNFQDTRGSYVPLQIVNPLKGAGYQADQPDSATKIEFYPEGGRLIYGLPSTIGFRLEPVGSGIKDYKGWIIGSRGDTVSSFNSPARGSGLFRFTPGADEKYVAVLANRPETYPLPLPLSSGYTLHLEKGKNGKFRAMVQCSPDLIHNRIYLLGQVQDHILFSKTTVPEGNTMIFGIDSSELMPGVNKISIYSLQGIPQAGCLYFKEPIRELGINITTDRPVYSRREKISLSLKGILPGADSTPVNYSVAVFRIDSLERGFQEHIESYLALGSVAEGVSIAAGDGRPSLRFSQIPPDMGRTGRKEISNLPEYAGQLLTVRVSDPVTHLPRRDVAVYLTRPDSNFQFLPSISDSNGICRFVLPAFFGEGEILLRADKNSSPGPTLDWIQTSGRPESSIPESNVSPVPIAYSDQQIEDLRSRILHFQAEKAFAGQRQDSFYIPYRSPDSAAFFGKGDKQYLLDDYTRFTTMEEVMREFIPEVEVRKSGRNYHFKVWNAPYRYYFDTDPLILLDGVPISVNQIIAYDPLKVKSITIVTRNFYQNGQTYNGIVSYKTYRGDLPGFTPDPSVRIINYEGLQLQRKFYSPDYSKPVTRQNHIPDFRELLYWNPDLDANAGKLLRLSFCSPDIPGQYQVVVQGLSINGKGGSVILRFLVK